MTNHLKSKSSGEVKFVDDLTVSETVNKFRSNTYYKFFSNREVLKLKSGLNQTFLSWMKTNVKEMRVEFSKSCNQFSPIILQVVNEAKLLRLTIASNLKSCKQHSVKKFKTDLPSSTVKTSVSPSSKDFAIFCCLRPSYSGIWFDCFRLFLTKIFRWRDWTR